MATPNASLRLARDLLRQAVAPYDAKHCGIRTDRIGNSVEFIATHVTGDLRWLALVPLDEADFFALSLLYELQGLRAGRKARTAA